MDKALKLAAVIILSCSTLGAQPGKILRQIASGGPASLTLTAGWSFGQIVPANHGNGCTGSTCTITPINTHTNGAWFFIYSGPTLESITAVTTGGGTQTLCGCANGNASVGYNDAATVTGGASGTTSVTITLSGTPSGSYSAYFFEILPPSGYTPSLDGMSLSVISSCSTSCTMANPTVSSTDGCLQYVNGNQTANLPNLWSAPYTTTFYTYGLGLNVTAGGSPTFNNGSTSTAVVSVGVCFKSSAGNFAFSGTSPTYAVVQAPSNGPISCSPTCGTNFTTWNAAGSGHLILLTLHSAVTANSVYISSVSCSTSCGTWAVPTSARQYSSAAGSVSTAYVLSSSSGGTAPTITATANCTSPNCWADVIEISRSTGSFSLDQATSGTNSASTGPIGVTLSNTGTNDVCMWGINSYDASAQVQTGMAITPLPPFGEGGFNNGSNTGAEGYLFNCGSSPASPQWFQTFSDASVNYGLSFK